MGMLDNYPGLVIRYLPQKDIVQNYYGLAVNHVLGLKRKPKVFSLERLRDSIVKADKSRVTQVVSSGIENHQAWNIEYRVFRNNQTLWLREQGFPVGKKGSPIFDIFIQDVSEFKKMHQKLNRELNQANSQASFKNEFFASISHEIRTPMNAVMGMSQILAKTELDAEQQHYVSTITNSAQSLVQIINDILDFSKLEAGKIEILDEHFDLEKLCLDVCHLLSPHANEKQLALYLDFKVPDKRKVRGDKNRIRQVLVNLLGNAIKFTPSGHVKLIVEADDKSRFVFRVIDTGIGISEEAQEHLFQAFSQADKSISKNFGGTGLGLRICQQLIVMMGGEIGVESEANTGSEFWFSVDLPIVNYTEVVKEAFKNKKAIVVENDPDQLAVTSDALRTCGIEVFPVIDSEDTLAMLAMDETYDFFVINRELHGLDGLKLSSLIKRDERYKDKPILLLTSIAKNEKREVFENAGVNAYVSLPFSPSLLQCGLERLFDSNDDFTTYVSSDLLIGETRTDENFNITGRVLIVDDVEVNRLVLNSILSNAGLATDFAENGQIAIEKIKTEDFDMVFMDCRMPILNGYDATRSIRELNGIVSQIPVVALTANAGEEERQLCLDAGMNGFVSKPFMEKDILVELKQWMPEANIVETAKAEEEFVEINNDKFIDINQWIAMKQTMDDEFDEFVVNTMSRISDYSDDLKKMFSRGDMSEMHEKSHALKGLAALLGGKEVAEIAGVIEKASKEKDFEIININIAKLDLSIQETDSVMKREINPDLEESIILF